MKEAAALLAKEKGSAFVLAGGTDLLVRLRTGFIEPDLLVDIKRIAATRTIQATPSGFRIGAAVTGAELARRSRWISPSRRTCGADPHTFPSVRSGDLHQLPQGLRARAAEHGRGRTRLEDAARA
jgi:hypothetical protein